MVEKRIFLIPITSAEEIVLNVNNKLISFPETGENYCKDGDGNWISIDGGCGYRSVGPELGKHIEGIFQRELDKRKVKP